ncbi:Hypothetical predicted protein [Cloeon dipterum]|uniref:Ig-like domain-containing protein n=1 Tax=Cloeon dipterum TaxID=197152 RepID=A0A8S1E6S1_9INSE|nr:Hypothetical predicted protein [Cloeon dipterum]
MAAHFAPARAIVGKPFVSAPSRDLIPNSLRQHVQRVTTSGRLPGSQPGRRPEEARAQHPGYACHQGSSQTLLQNSGAARGAAHQLQRMLAMVDAEALARLIADEPVVAGEKHHSRKELELKDLLVKESFAGQIESRQDDPRYVALRVTASQNCFRLGADNEGTMLPKSTVSSTSSANYSEHILGGCGRDVGLFGCAAVHFSHGGALRTRSGDSCGSTCNASQRQAGSQPGRRPEEARAAQHPGYARHQGSSQIEELCLKDKLLEDQRKIIVEIQIKLDEKQKELEELRQSLDTQDSAVDWLEADKQQLQQRLLEADEKLEKSVKVVQTLVLHNLELAARAAGADQIGSTTRRSTCGANWTKPGASFPAANRSSLLQLLDQSRSLDASALAVSAALEDSLLDHIHKFLDAPQHSVFIHKLLDKNARGAALQPRETKAIFNVRATANGKPPLDDVRVIEPRPSRTKQPPTTGNGRAESRPSQASDSQTLPSITRSLRDRRCCDGDTVTFECGLAPTPEQPDVRWEKDGKPLVIECDLVAEQDSAFARLTILQVCPEDEGEYTCVVRSKLGKVTTSACLIVDGMEELSRDHHRPVTHRARSALDQDTAGANAVNKRHRLKAAPPKLYAIPHNKVVEEGAKVRLQCVIAGHPTPWVTWDTDGLILTPSRRLTIKEKDDLRIVKISEVSVEDAGLYRVTLENDVGHVEASARLDVIGPSWIATSN